MIGKEYVGKVTYLKYGVSCLDGSEYVMMLYKIGSGKEKMKQYLNNEYWKKYFDFVKKLNVGSKIKLLGTYFRGDYDLVIE